MKKGFSFAVLSITILIMIILLTSMTVAGTNTVNNSKKLSFATEINMVEQAVNSYKQKNNGIYPIRENVVVDISNLNEFSVNQFEANGEDIVDRKVVLNEIDFSKISIVSLKYGNTTEGENDIYVVSPKTGKVYYAKGMKIGNKLYFTLTNELKNSLNNNSSQKINSDNSLVVFSASNVEWTNETVSVEVKVPISCSITSISVNGESATYATSQNSGYNIYTISGSENYSVEVKYFENSNESKILSATYTVNNVDNLSPTLQIDENFVPLKTLNESNLVGYIKILNMSDTLSGIKYLKYENNSVFAGTISDDQKNNIKSHFENNGKQIDGNVIPIEKGTRQITVYLEDKAGNWTMQSIDIDNI